MAPAPNSAKTLQQNRVRPVVPRPILPALPLSFVQKRKKENVAFVKPKKDVIEEQTKDISPAAEIAPSDTPTVTATEKTVNGTEETKADEKEAANEIELPEDTVAEVVHEPVVAEVEAVEEQPNSPATQTDEQEVAKEEVQESQSRISSEAPSTSSRSTYQMPPPFVPASQMVAQSPPVASSTIDSTSNGEAIVYPPFPPPLNSYQPQHHGHPSQTSLVFGGYPDSNNSSPAPQSMGHFPPPPFVQNDYHPQHSVQHNSHLSSNGGYSYTNNGNLPIVPPPGYYPRHDHHTSTVTDYPRRQMASYPTEGYSPVHTPHSGEFHAYDPPTPHSFHGLQTSGPNGDSEQHAAAYNQYLPGLPNGGNGQTEQYKQPRTKRPVSHYPVNFPIHPDGQPPLPTDHFDGLVPYLQSHVNNTEMADCTVVLSSTDKRYPPTPFPGHRLILARSPTLKASMVKQGQTNPYGQTLKVVSSSSHLRSDAFAIALQRLYGWPLLDHSFLAAFAQPLHGQSTRPHTAGSHEDRFSMGLAYAVAGHLLKMPPVVSRGLEIAASYINWNTIDKAINFEFESTAVDGDEESNRDQQVPGPILNILHQAAVNFLTTSFPAGFRFNSSVPDSRSKPRLPITETAHSNNHIHQLSQIRFGELGGDEAPDAVAFTLSRILINLPFQTLKAVLESPYLGNVQDRAIASLRYETMIAVVEEREKRRTNVLASSVRNSERSQSTAWEVAGWHEFVQSTGTNESRPMLAHTFVGFKSS